MVRFVDDSVFGFPFCSGPNFSMILSLKRKQKAKGSKTPVTSGDCLDASDLNAFLFSPKSRFRFGYLTKVGMQGNPRCPTFLDFSNLIYCAGMRFCMSSRMISPHAVSCF